jgi:hypothetical protein
MKTKVVLCQRKVFLMFCQHLFLDLLTEIAKKTHNMLKKGEAYLDKE